MVVFQFREMHRGIILFENNEFVWSGTPCILGLWLESSMANKVVHYNWQCVAFAKSLHVWFVSYVVAKKTYYISGLAIYHGPHSLQVSTNRAPGSEVGWPARKRILEWNDWDGTARCTYLIRILINYGRCPVGLHLIRLVVSMFIVIMTWWDPCRTCSRRFTETPTVMDANNSLAIWLIRMW